MIDLSNFKLWLTENTNYSAKTISNYVSRFKRADNILAWFDDIIYQFHLEQAEAYKELSCGVRSQIKKAVRLYFEFANAKESPLISNESKEMKILSLFANIGVAEARLKEIGFEVAVANELVERRAILYSKIYPETNMICGDITKKAVFDKIVKEALEQEIEIIIATPPCQGMSTVGQKVFDDERNRLICNVIEAIKEIKPKYVLIENVPMFFSTEIKAWGERILIPKLLERELENEYIIEQSVIDTKNYSVPQTRERAIVLMTKRNQSKQWKVPKKDKKLVTMKDAIGHLPKLDPFITDVEEDELLKILPHFYERREKALAISKWHSPPRHIKRQVVAMQRTRTGQTAFDNEVYYPVKDNGEAVKGFRNTYKRQNWDMPAYTVTMDNRKISSQNNVHPGEKESFGSGEDIYSDARVLTLYELMIIMTIPLDWPVPENTSEAFLRRIIGEGIPPLFTRKLFEQLKQEKTWKK